MKEGIYIFMATIITGMFIALLLFMGGVFVYEQYFQIVPNQEHFYEIKGWCESPYNDCCICSDATYADACIGFKETYGLDFDCFQKGRKVKK